MEKCTTTKQKRGEILNKEIKCISYPAWDVSMVFRGCQKQFWLIRVETRFVFISFEINQRHQTFSLLLFLNNLRNNCISSAFYNASTKLRERDECWWLREKVFRCECWVTKNVNCWFKILWFLPLFANRNMFHEFLINLLLLVRVIQSLIFQVSNYEF